MRLLATFVIAMGLFLSGVAQAQEYLNPCHTSLHAYENRVDSIAHGAMPGKLELSVTVIPSFTPEWSIGITSDKSSTYLTYVVFNQSLWHSSWVPAGNGAMKNDPASGHVVPRITTVKISRRLFLALLSEWKRSIGKARPTNISGFDGVSFKFELPGIKCASTWSPAPKSRDGKLVGIVEALRKLALSKGKEIEGGSDAILKALHDMPKI